MINVTVRYDKNERKIAFPCSRYVLDAKLEELGVIDMTEAKMFVTRVNDYKFFSFLEDDFVDLDELNILANRLQYLDAKELEKFECVAEEFNIRNSRDLINLTANLHRFTLIQDMSSPEQIGRTHYFTRLISIEDDKNRPTDFAKLGRELINSGTGRFTEHGMLFVSDDIPAINRYNGIPAPENLQGDKIVQVSVTKDLKTVSLWLPESENMLNRVLKEMDAGLDDSECDVIFKYYEGENEEWRESLKEILGSYGLITLNRVAEAINSFGAENELEKLSAIMEYADTYEPEDIIKLADNIDKFHFIKGATECSDMAQHVIDEISDYHISIELRDYFDDMKFGEDQMDEKQGRFVSGGLVYMKDDHYLQEILGFKEEHGMTML